MARNNHEFKVLFYSLLISCVYVIYSDHICPASPFPLRNKSPPTFGSLCVCDLLSLVRTVRLVWWHLWVATPLKKNDPHPQELWRQLKVQDGMLAGSVLCSQVITWWKLMSADKTLMFGKIKIKKNGWNGQRGINSPSIRGKMVCKGLGATGSDFFWMHPKAGARQAQAWVFISKQDPTLLQPQPWAAVAGCDSAARSPTLQGTDPVVRSLTPKGPGPLYTAGLR